VSTRMAPTPAPTYFSAPGGGQYPRNSGRLPTVRLYLDLCCLKRPFDAQDQPIVRLQTEAVVSILALPADRAELIRSPAQELENGFNPVQARREAVDLWLAQAPAAALHLASAELFGADVFLTVDLPLLKLATRQAAQLRVRVADPVGFREELSQWTH